MSNKPTALVLCGDGINCELETAVAFRMAGFEAQICHINDLIRDALSLSELSKRYAALALPGGFSFGDDLTSGKVLALKIKHALRWDLNTYASRGGLVIGICNGFQALIRLGVFGKEVSITANAQGRFLNSWVKLSPGSGTRCLWLKGIGTLELPIRHGEGRVLISSTLRSELFQKMERLGMLCLKYQNNPTGSEENLAGLCDATGRVFGLMPHPEAFVRWTAHPEWTLQPSRASAPGQGLQLFENAYHEAARSS